MSELKDIKQLKFDEHNFNKHNERGMGLIQKSITENKFGRSILLDKDNNIIAGNGVTESAMKLGHTKVRIIETDGDELIAVKRKDLSIDSKEGRSLALADNAVAAVDLEWDEDELKKAQEKWDVMPEEWGAEVEMGGLFEDGLPEELQGLDLTPTELQNIKGEDKVKAQKIIIVYDEETLPKLLDVLGLEKLNKVLYSASELYDAKYES